jgi:hypothetical protein
MRFRLVPARTARSVSIIAPRSHQARTTAQQSTEATFSCGYLGRWIAAQAATAGDSKDAAPPGANESRYELRCAVILWELRHTGAGVGPTGGVCWRATPRTCGPPDPLRRPSGAQVSEAVTAGCSSAISSRMRRIVPSASSAIDARTTR